MRSTSGYFFSFGTEMFSWCSKKQDIVAQSTAEAEYIAAASAMNQTLWIRKLLADLYMEQKKSSEIFDDNKLRFQLQKLQIILFHMKDNISRSNFIS